MVSSWKWVAKRLKHRIWVAMCLERALAGVESKASDSERRGVASVSKRGGRDWKTRCEGGGTAG